MNLRFPGMPITLGVGCTGRITATEADQAAGHFSLDYGPGQHAPDEFVLIESTNPKIQAHGGATLPYVEYHYELTKSRQP